MNVPATSTTAIVAISAHGAGLARRLAKSLSVSVDVQLHLERRFHQQDAEQVLPETPFDLPVRPLVTKLFGDCERLVLFMPVGAAVRLLAPSLRDKHHDPAVVCVDDAGRFAVSLLSGHLGGADRLTQEVARALGANPVVTSASHVMGTVAVDLLGQEFGWQIEAEPIEVTRASAAMVNGAPVGVYQDAGELDWWPSGEPLPVNVTVYHSREALMAASWAAALIITDKTAGEITGKDTTLPGTSGSPESAEKDRAVVFYRPRTLVAGMGCRRGVPVNELDELLVNTFRSCGLATASLRCIATADLKQDERGLIDLAGKYGVPLQCYRAGELNAVFDEQHPADLSSAFAERSTAPPPDQAAIRPTPRDQVRQLLGMWGVSEPAALLAAGNRGLLAPRVKSDRATIAVARVDFAPHPS